MKDDVDVETLNKPNDQYTLLIAEDDEVNMMILTQMVSMFGYKFITAEDGVEAVARTCEFRPDVVLMDISMPRMNGVEAAYRIQTELGGNAPPIIAVTANVTEIQRKECEGAGFHGFVPKPVDFDELEAAITDARSFGSAAIDDIASSKVGPVIDPSVAQHEG